MRLSVLEQDVERVLHRRLEEILAVRRLCRERTGERKAAKLEFIVATVREVESPMEPLRHAACASLDSWTPSREVKSLRPGGSHSVLVERRTSWIFNLRRTELASWDHATNARKTYLSRVQKFQKERAHSRNSKIWPASWWD